MIAGRRSGRGRIVKGDGAVAKTVRLWYAVQKGGKTVEIWLWGRLGR